jgi:hypothetical protein
MARQQTRKQFLNFTGGLHTEASPLLFPENTAKALDNVDLSRDGSIKRRLGLDYELSSAYSTPTFASADLATHAISFHEWESIDGDDSVNFLVIQVGGSLYFHNAGTDSPSTKYLGSISLAPVRTNADYESYVVKTDSAKGKLFVVSPRISPVYIEYDADQGVFRGVKITVRIRDTDGISEELISPTLFGDDVTPPTYTDPLDDLNDTLEDFDFPEFTETEIGTF